MKKPGYIKLFRALDDWEWIDDYIMVYFWVRVLLMANWEDKEWHGEVVERGSFVTTLNGLAKKVNLSFQQVRTCLSKLQSNKQILVDSTSKRTKITICKYETYQGGATNEQQTNNTQSNNPATQTKESSEYSDSYESSYSSQEDKNILNISQNAPAPVHVHAQAQDPLPPAPSPYPSPFILTSMEREMVRLGQYTEVDFKRRHLERNLLVFADQIGMDESERKKFLDYYCSPKPGTSEIRAEGDPYFNLRLKAENWMEKRRSPEQSPQPSRIEQYAAKSQQLTRFINELYGDSPDAGAANGSEVSPDEQ